MQITAAVNVNFTAGSSGNRQPFAFVAGREDTHGLLVTAAADQYRIAGAGAFNGGPDPGNGFRPA